MCRVQLLTLNPQIIELDIINTRVLVFPWVSTKLRPSLNFHYIDFQTKILGFVLVVMCRVQLLILNPKIIELDIINTRVLVFPWVSTKLRPSLNFHYIDFQTKILGFSIFGFKVSSWTLHNTTKTKT